MHISAVKLIIITRHRDRREPGSAVFVLTSFFSSAGCYFCFSVIDFKTQSDISGNQRLRSI